MSTFELDKWFDIWLPVFDGEKSCGEIHVRLQKTENPSFTTMLEGIRRLEDGLKDAYVLKKQMKNVVKSYDSMIYDDDYHLGQVQTLSLSLLLFYNLSSYTPNWRLAFSCHQMQSLSLSLPLFHNLFASIIHRHPAGDLPTLVTRRLLYNPLVTCLLLSPDAITLIVPPLL